MGNCQGCNVEFTPAVKKMNVGDITVCSDCYPEAYKTYIGVVKMDSEMSENQTPINRKARRNHAKAIKRMKKLQAKAQKEAIRKFTTDEDYRNAWIAEQKELQIQQAQKETEENVEKVIDN